MSVIPAIGRRKEKNLESFLLRSEEEASLGYTRPYLKMQTQTRVERRGGESTIFSSLWLYHAASAVLLFILQLFSLKRRDEEWDACVVVYSYNPSTWELQAEGCWYRQASL